MKKTTLLVLASITVLFAGCSKIERKLNKVMGTTPVATVAPGTTTTTTTTTTITTQANTKIFTVVGSNIKYDTKEIKVKKGDTVKVTFKNQEGFHDFKIDEFKVATKQIGEGKEETVTFVADKAGSFEFYCSVGQHRKMGMKGMLIVE